MPIYGKTPNQSKTLSGHSPLTFYSNGDNLTSYTIIGNGKQDGIPSPDNIIMPDFCGVRTGNLFDDDNAEFGKWVNSNGTIVTYATYAAGYDIKVGTASEFAIKHYGDKPYSYSMAFYDNNGDFLSRVHISKPSDSYDTFPVPENAVSARFQAAVNTSVVMTSVILKAMKLMLTPGSTPLPYEPYGYKLDISNGGENLFDKNNSSLVYETSNLAESGYWKKEGRGITLRVPCLPNTQYTLSCDTTSSIWRISTIDTDDDLVTSIPATDIVRDKPQNNFSIFTTNSTAKYIIVQFEALKTPAAIQALMLNLGSTAKPYSPYNRTTMPIYLGQVQTVRRIKKLVLTGDENITSGHLNESLFNVSVTDYKRESNAITSVCTHYVSQKNADSFDAVNDKRVCFYTGTTPGTKILYIRDLDYASIDAFKSYLTAQYNAGTPVTVWYVLAEPQTAIVNEPLAKIGDYEDTLVYYTGAPEVPTAEGKTVLSVDTELRPSLITIQYTSGNEPIKKIYGNVSGQYKEVSKVLDASGNLVWRPPVYYDWNTIREVVRAGKAAQYYPIGSILYDNFDANTGVAYQVVGYDKHFDPALTAAGYTHSMTLCELLLTDVITFDAIEAFLYVTTAIPAGTYKFTIPNYDASYGGNKTYYFTSTAELPVNSQIVMNWPSNQTPKTVTGYAPTASLTAMENTTAATGWNALTLTEWVEGTSPTATDLGTIAGPSTQAGTSTYGDMNHIHRARYGSNNYYESGVRQYINSTGAANTWWKPSNKFDRPYGSRSIAGKLNTLNQDFVNVLAYPTIKSKANTYFETTAEDGTKFTLGQDYTITSDKMFLLSPVEVGFSTTDTSIGTLLDYYVDATNDTRIKIRKSNNNPYYWWLRTPYLSNAYGVRSVSSSGALSGNIAASSSGVAPACIIQ